LANQEVLKMLNIVAGAVQEFLMLALIFGLITAVFEGMAFLKPSARQKRNWRVNLSYFAFDLLVMMPLLVLVSQGIRGAILNSSSPASALPFTPSLAAGFVILLAVMVSDFIGYWRHRLMHIAWLWPIHAAHHSDEDVTWFSLVRFHPLNRLIAVLFDVVILTLLDFPVWAVVFSNRVRHFYGYFVHSDFSWRYGPLKFLFVSPFLHRWHHATDMAARDKNFATVFSIYDVLFGTFYCPAQKAVSLGVDDPDYPTGFVGQTMYPLRLWRKSLFDQASSKAL
jgi:sterol desaturase/sphingolipid hydroxylase (fatty acid hydroxylase superfamily)